MMFRVAYPVLLTVLVILVVAWFLYRIWKKPPGIIYSMTSEMLRLAGRGNLIMGKVPLILRAMCLVLLVLAVSRPQLYNVSRDIRSPGVDIMMCIDTSGSMRAMDFTIDNKPVTRLTAVKKVVNDFIKKRTSERIGLVVFGEEAFTQSPLTMDKGLLLELVNNMEIGMAGDRTAIGSAIAIGGKRLKDLKAESKILIVLTDGRNNTGSITPVQAADVVQSFGIKIYTIGVGGKGEAPFEVQTLFGKRLIYQHVDLDEATLQKVARIGKGRYFLAADSKRLSEIYDIIDREEKTEVTVKEYFHFRELYLFFLIPALLCLGLEMVLRMTLLRVIP